ncbi:hypothetical protein CORC01_09734 [Colletotrichum orchidophilum]|uniref:Integral membrane protein n=1 Tax=Colletotrichum orchidophilum TaxID=1209926 RepID=A0A1G4B0J3_9PEZI|nr:uncharacterized protein CORC01_09734 [Colletotrichum orchidophilum]OHE94940.1 hypothetical protein CORC01_09734 [Colletotrichum orchidophilum]
MSTPLLPVYFELSWSILSTIGAANVFLGFLIVGITTFSQITVVPIISSIAGAIANGLCYYAFYDDSYSLKSKAIASVFGDIFWMIQEVGLSFYSYVLLRKILKDLGWKAFNILFWLMVLSIISIRIMIAVSRAKFILRGNTDLQSTVNSLHIGYFVLIASLECLSSFFLLKTFAEVKSTSLRAALKGGLFKYLMRSTEVRLATLALIGTMRAVTYSSQIAAQSATNAASQIDRFAYTLECLFPVVMFIDILASKLVVTTHVYHPAQPRRPPLRGFSSYQKQNDWCTATQNSERLVEVRGGRRTSSQEDIFSAGPFRSNIGLYGIEPTSLGGINKTVEVSVRHSTPARPGNPAHYMTSP